MFKPVLIAKCLQVFAEPERHDPHDVVVLLMAPLLLSPPPLSQGLHRQSPTLCGGQPDPTVPAARILVPGLRRVYATKLLSHFTARFEPVQPPVAEEGSTGSTGLTEDCGSPGALSASSSQGVLVDISSGDDNVTSAGVTEPKDAARRQCFPALSAAHGCDTRAVRLTRQCLGLHLGSSSGSMSDAEV